MRMIIPKIRNYSVPDEQRQNNTFDFTVENGSFEPKEVDKRTLKRVKAYLIALCTDELKHTYTVLLYRKSEDTYRVVCDDPWIDKRFRKGGKILTIYVNDKKKKSQK